MVCRLPLVAEHTFRQFLPFGHHSITSRKEEHLDKEQVKRIQATDGEKNKNKTQQQRKDYSVSTDMSPLGFCFPSGEDITICRNVLLLLLSLSLPLFNVVWQQMGRVAYTFLQRWELRSRLESMTLAPDLPNGTDTAFFP